MSINPEIIDHTNLKLDATEKDIEKLCDEAKRYGFGAVCIRPNYVVLAKNLLKDTPIKVCTVIGFHTGLNPTEEKVKEAEKAITDGADELDMVINFNALKRDEFDYVKNDISSIKKVAKDKILKVIIEAGLLSDNQKQKACQLVENAGADFVKTSTGFAKDEKGNKLGATIQDVKLIKSVVGDRLGIKAAGGINTADFGNKLIQAGATRIGASASITLVSNPKNISNGERERELQLKYAWEWFKYHADQRLRAFYFYLIIIGALAIGYLSAIQVNEKVNQIHFNQVDKIIPWLFLLGCIVSIAFLCLEIRNVELVNIGRDKLKELGLKVTINDANPKYTKALEKTFPSRLKFLRFLFKHELWLRFIYILIASFTFYIFLDYKRIFICSFWKSCVPSLILIFSLGFAFLLGRRKN